MTVVEVADLSVAFGRRTRRVEAVDQVSLTLSAGECLALVGESGSGKSVTARALLGLAQREGEVRASRLIVGGQDTGGWSQRDWRALRGGVVGIVLQDALSSLDPLRPVGRELADALRRHTQLAASEIHARSVELLHRVGVPDPETRLRQYPHELSGGLRQRVLIATALAGQPRIIVADEPTTALDATVGQQVIDLLRSIRDSGTAVLLISHDLAVVSSIADRVAVLRNGRIVEHGTTIQVLNDPAHEYTRTLLDAIPSAHAPGTRLSSSRFDVTAARSTPVPENAGSPLLEVQGASKRYPRPGGGHLVALDQVDLEVRHRECVGIVGESGSGKSTLAQLLLGLQEPDQGRVLLDGGPWSELPESRKRNQRRRIQTVFQDPLSSFDPRFTVHRVLNEALRAGQVPSARRRQRSAQLLDAVGLPTGILDRRPIELSGGQRQRVAIARALAPSPEVIICDEPVSALDVSVQAHILDLLKDVRHELGVAIVFISHDLGVVHHISDRVVVMTSGRIVETGPAEELFAQPGHAYTQRLLDAVPRLATSTKGRL